MKRWLSYAKPYLRYFILGPLCMIIEVIGEVVLPKLLASVINSANNGTLTVGSSIGTMLLMALTAIIMMAGGTGGAYFSSKASVNFAADIRSDLYKKIQSFSFSNVDKFSTGSLVTRLTNDVTQIQNLVNMLLRMALRAPGMMIAAIIMAVIIQPKLSLVFAVAMPLLLIVVVFIIKKGAPLFQSLQEHLDALNSKVQESVTNVRVVKSFVREKFGIELFRKTNSELKEAGLKAMNIVIFMTPVMTFFMNATIIAVIFFGGRIVLNGDMAIGDLSAFITYVTQILSSLLMVAIMLMISSRATASAKRIAEVLDEHVDISDAEAKCPDKKVEQGSIEFKDVSFRYYSSSEDAVLDHVSLAIPGKSTVGIIGSTGCGKSTLVSLIVRLYDCDDGEVLVDGVNVKDYSLVNLRDGVSMVLQKNMLFSGTIADNLRWGNEDASDEQIKRAAEFAQADGFISAFKEGYSTNIEQGGSNVSGGQKQRLCIARALLKESKILILDDSTSAVDTATEAKIRAVFDSELEDVTKIIIAQRISSVMDADMIVVMNDGKITGTGTHEQLLESNEEYREIYESQIRAKKEGA